MFAVIASLTLKEGALDRFLSPIILNAATSLSDEKGCHQFDICSDPDRPNEVILYELYTDAAAFDVHLNSDHFAVFDAATADLIASKDVRTYRKVRQ